MNADERARIIPYIERYRVHLERGDDPDAARLRIIEEGCPTALAERIQRDAIDPYDPMAQFGEEIL
jgi:hypothetical protein